jgi:hypothetical protein
MSKKTHFKNVARKNRNTKLAIQGAKTKRERADKLRLIRETSLSERQQAVVDTVARHTERLKRENPELFEQFMAAREAAEAAGV